MGGEHHTLVTYLVELRLDHDVKAHAQRGEGARVRNGERVPSVSRGWVVSSRLEFI